MQPFKVTIELVGPVATGDMPLHLDSLLAAMRVKLAKLEFGEAINPREFADKLPLERHETSAGWVFKASTLRPVRKVAQETWMQTGRINLTKLNEDRESGYLLYGRAKPITAGGHLKSSLFHLQLETYDKLEGFGIGRIDEVDALLSMVTNVMVRRNLGFGKVKRIVVEPVQMEHCNWQRRNMPADTAIPPAGYAIGHACLRSPYWDRADMVRVFVPL